MKLYRVRVNEEYITVEAEFIRGAADDSLVFCNYIDDTKQSANCVAQFKKWDYWIQLEVEK